MPDLYKDGDVVESDRAHGHAAGSRPQGVVFLASSGLRAPYSGTKPQLSMAALHQARLDGSGDCDLQSSGLWEMKGLPAGWPK